jgi:NADPH:quinone reductase-like Zn-dependent oxidoreductase
MTKTNTAAWLRRKHGRLEAGPAVYTAPDPEQIVVRNHAVAINPLDWIIQVEGNLLYGWLKYPVILGADVAGEVVEVGSAVTRFQVGDRVLGHAISTDKDSAPAAGGGFQQYTVLLERLAAPLPAAVGFEEAATLPLAVSTAACGLFEPDQLGLRRPEEGAPASGKTVLVWGGSTSVGAQAIQLAVAAGYEVVATASPRNFEHVASLGASLVFDYNSPTVEQDIIAAFANRTLAGALSFGTTGAPACVRIVGACSGNRSVSIGTPPVSYAPLADGSLATRIGVTARLISSNVALQVASRRRGVRTKYIFGSSLKNSDLSAAIYSDFLPAALTEGRYRILPRPHVVGHGLGAVQEAMDQQRRGVSFSKLVVTL